MNNLKKIRERKLTENGDVAYKTTGNNLIDLLFMTPYFEKHLDEAHIGESNQEKLFSMYVRDPRFGMGRRDLGRTLMEQSNVSPEYIVKAGRFDDLLYVATDECIDLIHSELLKGDELAKKWMPRLTGKEKRIAKELCKIWNLTEKEYRKLIKLDTTVEYKLSYAEKGIEGTPLNELFGKNDYVHPLVDKINFEQVPSLAMTKYLKLFSTREDIKNRFGEYIKAVKENKAKVNTKTANVHDAYKAVRNTEYSDAEDNADVIGKKIVEQETEGLALSCICVLDTSGSMGSLRDPSSLCSRSTSVCHSLATHSTYAPNQLISFSSYPQLMTIKGNTLKEQYNSMQTGDCSNTDLGAVFNILMGLKTFPEYVIIMSDMEFDKNSSFNYKKWYELTKAKEANVKLIWWTFNDRNKTVTEMDENGNIFMSGYDIQALLMLPNVINQEEYIEKILSKYAKNIGC